MSAHYLEELWGGGPGSRLVLQIRWDDARLIVQLDRAAASSSLGTEGAGPLENSFIGRYNTMCENDDIEEEDAVADEILDAVVEAGRGMFDEIAPPTGATRVQDLDTLLFPREYTFYFKTLGERAELIRNHTVRGEYRPWTFWSVPTSGRREL